MPTKTRAMKMLVITAIVGFALQIAGAQSGAKSKVAAPGTREMSGVEKTLKAAADALGMPRIGGAGGGRLPQVDAVNRMEVWASGTSYGPAANASAAGPASKIEYHAELGYDPPAMRLQVTRTDPGGSPQSTIQTVRDNFAWNESMVGAGLEPGRGTATPAMATVKDRLLQIWILPYGVVKAGIAAGDQTKMSMENGATVITFPLSGELAGVTVKATLDAKNFVTKVETQTSNPALSRLVMEAEYSDYADHGEILTDVKSPGHIVQKRGGSPVLDIQIKMWDANNPYLVFPVPANVKAATAK